MAPTNHRVLPSLLGRGLKYPLQSSDSGGLALVEGDELVNQSITEILLTGIGERPFVVRNGVPFGSRIPTYLFKSAEAVKDVAGYEAKRALETWEPRIIVNYVEVTDIRDSGTRDPRFVRIEVNFRYRSSNSPSNWVKDFPTETTRTT